MNQINEIIQDLEEIEAGLRKILSNNIIQHEEKWYIELAQNVGYLSQSIKQLKKTS